MSQNLIHGGTRWPTLRSANARAFVGCARNRLGYDAILRAPGKGARVCGDRVGRCTLYVRESTDRAKNIRFAGRSASLRMK